MKAGDKVLVNKPPNGELYTELLWDTMMDEYHGKILTLSGKNRYGNWKVEENDFIWFEHWMKKVDGGFGCGSSEYLTSNLLTAYPWVCKKMSTIKKIFQSKEDKAMEFFGLGSSKELNREGRDEFIDYLYETMPKTKKEFLIKITEAYKEAKK